MTAEPRIRELPISSWTVTLVNNVRMMNLSIGEGLLFYTWPLELTEKIKHP